MYHLVSEWMYVIARSRLTTPCTVLGMRTDMSINASLSVLGTPAYFSKRTRHIFDEFREVRQLLVVKGWGELTRLYQASAWGWNAGQAIATHCSRVRKCTTCYHSRIELFAKNEGDESARESPCAQCQSRLRTQIMPANDDPTGISKPSTLLVRISQTVRLTYDKAEGSSILTPFHPSG